jgi:hypothetical protein
LFCWYWRNYWPSLLKFLLLFSYWWNCCINKTKKV